MSSHSEARYMGVRDAMRQRPRVAAAAAGGVLVLAVAAIVVQLYAGRPRYTSGIPAFFSADDGKTWFAADGTLIPPFPHEGGQAVRAHVYSCGGRAFVAYLERYTPDARAAMEGARRASAEGKMPDIGAIQRATISGREVKKPGSGEWVRTEGNFARYGPIVTPKCPDGAAGEPLVVEP
jgi:hypothetical protein